MTAEMYRHWIELRELTTGTVREIPLQVMRRVHIPTRKDLQPRPDEQILCLQDGELLIEEPGLDELKMRLREAYPDALFERTLYCERDVEAEARHEAAMNELARVFARAAVDRVFGKWATPNVTNNEWAADG